MYIQTELVHVMMRLLRRKTRFFLILLFVTFFGLVFIYHGEVEHITTKAMLFLGQKRFSLQVKYGLAKPCTKCLDKLNHIRTIAELRDSVSATFDLQKSIAIYKGDINPEKMQFIQNGFIGDKWNLTVNYEHLTTIGHQKTCALVGSSGILYNSSCGKEIDKHSAVLRMNMAPTEGFQNDVGVKTSIIALNSYVVQSMYEYLSGNNNTIASRGLETLKVLETLNDSIVWIPYELSFYYGVFNLRDAMMRLKYVAAQTKEKMHFGYRLAYAPVPVWPQRLNRFWEKFSVSEGFTIFTMSILFCDQISLYGFWPFRTSPSGEPVYHHYYDKEWSAKLENSPILLEEYYMYQVLSEKGIIRFVKQGDCLK